MEITGKIIKIGELNKVSDKFTKLEFVIKTADQYPQFIMMQLTQDRTDLMLNYKLNDEVNCVINIRGREWTSPSGEVKYFNTIECWKITLMNRTELNTAEPDNDGLPF